MNFVTIYPVFNQAFYTSEHPEGELNYLGDALGRDFVAVKFIDGFCRTYLGDGKRNEDWFSYKLDILAPCDAIVERVNINSIENNPGSHTNKPAGSVTFRCKDCVRIVYAHVTDVSVEVNDTVVVGQPFAKCGNNGTSWHPHVHVGAWKDGKPLQINVNLSALGKIQREQGSKYFFLEDDEETLDSFRDSFRQK